MAPDMTRPMSRSAGSQPAMSRPLDYSSVNERGLSNDVDLHTTEYDSREPMVWRIHDAPASTIYGLRRPDM